MRKSKKILKKQREFLDERIREFVSRVKKPNPKNGWLKAVRESLGLSSAQLSRRMGLSHTHVHKLENREKVGSVTIASLSKAANAMGCELVYSIVPKNESSFDELLEKRCLYYAKKSYEAIQQSMVLEKQGLTDEQINKQVQKLTKHLKSSLSPKIWEK